MGILLQIISEWFGKEIERHKKNKLSKKKISELTCWSDGAGVGATEIIAACDMVKKSQCIFFNGKGNNYLSACL